MLWRGLGSEQAKVIHLQSQAVGAERCVSSIQKDCDEALARVEELTRKLNDNLSAEREKAQAKERASI
ncbi:unnamed protein product [Linum trigynum]|uniref:Uncharacterized protein n=1 Tax=Linum trigynum TaxID=586398 RepID=A0AAV2ERA1_9ROSI